MKRDMSDDEDGGWYDMGKWTEMRIEMNNVEKREMNKEEEKIDF